jgi:hypothetical protein
MIMSTLRPCCFGAAGLFLLAACMLLAPSGGAQAQLNPQELLKQVLRGERQNLTCLYDDAQRHALLAD